MLLLLAAVAAFQVPDLAKANVTTDDYPRVAWNRDDQGVVGYSVLLTPDGKVERCEVTRSSGVANLDQATCVYAFTRFKWQPARDMRGNPAYGLFRGFFTWQYPGQAHRPWPNAVNLEISLAALPAAMKASPSAMVGLVVNGNCEIEDCTVVKSSGVSQLDGVACGEVAKAKVVSAPVDDAGKPLPSIQTLQIGFVAPGTNHPN